MSIATKIKKEFARFLRRLGLAPTEPAQTPAPQIDWRFGGFDGSRAVEDAATQIADLRIARGKLAYRWSVGSLRNWGLADGDAGALACAFYWDGARWVGGKFDWISTSRTTRGLENLGGYHGWDERAFYAAPRRAFCVVSRDGARRTNLIETEEPK